MPEACVVPGCVRQGKHKLGVRCRVWDENTPGKGKTGALWAPDTAAFLCDDHAMSGARITLLYEPNEAEEISVRVIATQQMEERTTPIKHLEVEDV